MNYKMSDALRERLMTVIDKMSKRGINGNIYHYNKGECSCCFGTDAKFELNDNIPHNWGIYDSKDTRKAFHKITFDLNVKQATILVRELRAALKKSGWKVQWGGTTNDAIMLYQQVAI